MIDNLLNKKLKQFGDIDMKLINLLCIGMPFFIAGCGNFNSIHRSLDVDEGKGAFIDIKQRAVIVSKHVDVDGKNVHTFVCAEPSPDAMSAYASETSISVPDKVKIANAMQEGASFTGLRTQSIQLLRDGMYRLCEARLSGTLDNSEYYLLLRRYQRNMVALLAIEQLTGTVKAPVTLISTTGSASLAQDIEQSEAQIEKLQSELVVLNSQLANEKIKEDTADDEMVSSLNTKITNKTSLIDALKQSITNNRSILVKGAATASTIEQSSNTNNINATGNQDKLIATVEKIVMSIIETDDLPAMCFNQLNGVNKKTADYLFELCLKIFNSSLHEKDLLFAAQLRLYNAYIQKGELTKASDALDNMITNQFRMKSIIESLPPQLINEN